MRAATDIGLIFTSHWNYCMITASHPFHFILFSSPTSLLTQHSLSISNILVATRTLNNRKYEASQQYRYILVLFSSFSISPLVHSFTGSTNRNNSKARPNTGLYGQWLLLVLQEGKECFSLLFTASALVSLQRPVYQFALGNQMLQSSVFHKKVSSLFM